MEKPAFTLSGGPAWLKIVSESTETLGPATQKFTLAVYEQSAREAAAVK